MRLGILLLSIAAVCCAQGPATQPTPNQRLATERALLQYQVEHLHDDEAAPLLAEQRAAKERQKDFCRKAENFVSLWGQFASEMNARGTFNAKLAKKVAKAFHDLEKSEGWPVR